VRLPGPVGEINDHLCRRHGIVGGYDLGRDYPSLADHMLIAVTEINARASIDRLVRALAEVAA
jgi:glycine dehydrogenase subunit 1